MQQQQQITIWVSIISAYLKYFQTSIKPKNKLLHYICCTCIETKTLMIMTWLTQLYNTILWIWISVYWCNVNKQCSRTWSCQLRVNSFCVVSMRWCMGKKLSPLPSTCALTCGLNSNQDRISFYSSWKTLSRVSKLTGPPLIRFNRTEQCLNWIVMIRDR